MARNALCGCASSAPFAWACILRGHFKVERFALAPLEDCDGVEVAERACRAAVVRLGDDDVENDMRISVLAKGLQFA